MSEILSKWGYYPEKENGGIVIENIAKNINNMATPEIYKECFSFMDLTSLHTQDSEASIRKLVSKVDGLRLEYPDYPMPASICVYPNFAGTVREALQAAEVHVTTVGGCFPTSQSFIEVKKKECEMAVKAGADEVDIVLALNSFLAGDLEKAGAEILAIRRLLDRVGKTVGKRITLKVIIETGLLVSHENIASASFLAMENGADFIKTSTGKVEVNATPAAAFIMCRCIKVFYEKTGKKVGFKAAGGISTAMDAVAYYAIVSAILGKGWLNRDGFRLGVSRLGNALMSAVEQKKVVYF